MTNYEILLSCPLFSGLGISEIYRIFSGVLHRTRKYSKGELVALSGEECNNLLIVLRGSVKTEMADFSGKTLKMENLSAPQSLAIAFLYGKSNHFPVDIVANEDVEILFIPKESVTKMLQTSEIFLHNFMNSISNRAQFLSRKIRFLSFKTIRAKIAHYILQMAVDGRNNVVLPMSQQELAEFFGVARPSLARAIAELENEGLIRTKRREIEIIDKKSLGKILN